MRSTYDKHARVRADTETSLFLVMRCNSAPSTRSHLENVLTASKSTSYSLPCEILSSLQRASRAPWLWPCRRSRVDYELNDFRRASLWHHGQLVVNSWLCNAFGDAYHEWNATIGSLGLSIISWTRGMDASEAASSGCGSQWHG